MYKVYCDGLLLYHSKLESLKIFKPSIELEVNKTGSFEFTVYPDHPRYDLIKKLKSIITVFQDDFLLFRGRVLDDEIGWHNEKTIFCEGDMAFLLDSVLRPFSFSGTPAEFLAYIIGLHNAQVDATKQFQLGNVTVEGYIAYDAEDYITTKETIDKALLDALGGYFSTRFEDGVAYVDYLSQINLLAPQTVEFGKNLLDLKRTTKGEDIATAIIPLGAKEEGSENRLNITSVNNGVDYVYNQEAVDMYGWIFKAQTWDDVTEASNLLTKGNAFLNEQIKMLYSIDLDAADMATVGANIESFHLGVQVDVESNPHEIDQRFLVTKLSLDLLHPASNKMTLGSTIYTFTEKAVRGQISAENVMMDISSSMEEKLNLGLLETETKLSAQIAATSESITSTVMEEVYLKSDTDALISSVTNQITQTSEDVEIRFTEFSQNIDAVVAGTDAQFEEISKYIRFVDGNIVLGEEGNELTLTIQNDRISFMDAGIEVAYFSNNKLYVTDGEFINSLQLGNFAFIPRSNGNLSFKKL